jgi:hypothetical protein
MSRPTKRMLHPILTVLLACLGFAAVGCGNPDDLDDPANVEAQESALTTGGLVYDNINLYGTAEWYDGVRVHVCPTGYAMQGTYGDTWFKCRPFTPVLGSARRKDDTMQSTLTPPYGAAGYNTSYTQMHTCLPGETMVGWLGSKNWLICQQFVTRPGFYTWNYRDDGTQDPEVNTVTYNKPPTMHVCRSTGDLMIGVQNSKNQLGCVSEALSLPSPH